MRAVPGAMNMNCVELPGDAAGAALRAVQLGGAYVAARALHVSIELGLADQLCDGPRSVETLAETVGVETAPLRRLLRLLASHEVFVESPDGAFGLGPIGHAIRRDAAIPAAAAIRLLSAPGMRRSFDDLFEAIRSARPNLHQDLPRPLYRAGADPDAARLADAMAAFHAGTPDAVAETFDFSRSQVVVDVGGSTGELIAAVLTRNPHLTGVICDRPATAAAARERLAARGLAGRCEVMPVDFFVGVPSGGDTYMLAHIINDWSDEKAKRILQNCRGAMDAGGRLLVIEPVPGEEGDRHGGAFLDLLLLTASEGRHRRREEHADLLAATGFALRRIHPIRRAASIIEAEAV